MNCGKVTLCLPGVCTCDATHWWGAPPMGRGDFLFDLQVGTGTMEGAISGLSEKAPVKAHFMRKN